MLMIFKWLASVYKIPWDITDMKVVGFIVLGDGGGRSS
jgi:hypothetical protein